MDKRIRTADPPRAVRLAAHAKINLTLDIVGRLPNGYHAIESVMHSIPYADRVQVFPADKLSVAVNGAEHIPTDQRNTAYQAALRYYDALGAPPAAGIVIDKVIPDRAGLAGGSADAAAVLRALNQIHNGALPQDTLLSIAAAVGADVPFCLTGGAALATGTGTTLRPLPPLPRCYIVVVKPEIGVSTAAAYRAVDRSAGWRRPNTAALCRALERGDLEEIGGLLCNVFEQALALREVAKIRKRLAAFHPLGCAMTGSGSAVYALFGDCNTATAAATDTGGKRISCEPEAAAENSCDLGTQ